MIAKNTFLNFSVFTIPVLQDNYIFILKASNSSKLCVVDPALAQPVIDFLESKKWTLNTILNTHHHQDHIGGNAKLKKHYQASILAPINEAIVADQKLNQHSIVQFAGETVQIIEAPGHTLGHILYYFTESKVLFAGDCLFSLGCGRLFEGSPQQMINSLNKICQLPKDTQIFCAHEYSLDNARFALSIDPNNIALQNKAMQIQTLRKTNTPSIPFSLKEEQACNPFLRAHTTEIKKGLNLDSSTPDWQSFAKLRQLKDHFC